MLEGEGAVGSPSVKNLKNRYWNGFMNVKQKNVFIIKKDNDNGQRQRCMLRRQKMVKRMNQMLIS